MLSLKSFYEIGAFIVTLSVLPDSWKEGVQSERRS